MLKMLQFRIEESKYGSFSNWKSGKYVIGNV